MSEFYVYGLIDPRNNSIFYIGKGKDKRVFNHSNEKQEINSNIDKLKIINEIKKDGLDVEHIFFAQNLKEETALLLEKILIYRIGRKIFDEGPLTNIVPGGLWTKNSSLFVNKANLPNTEKIKADYPELIPILEVYPHTAIEFKGLSCHHNSKENNLYVYDDLGKLIHTWDIDYFINIIGLGHALDLIDVIKNTTDPVYAWNRIWSKCYLDSKEETSKIPFDDFDIIDLKFIIEINNSLKNKENNIINCLFQNGNKRGKAIITKNGSELSLEYYYSNGFKKHYTTYLENKLHGNCTYWYSNGVLKEEINYIENKAQNRKRYYQNGKLELIENLNLTTKNKIVKTWFESGNLNFESNEDGRSFTYFESGALQIKSIRIGDINKGGYLESFEYTEFGKLKKETKQYFENGLLHGFDKIYYETGELKKYIDYTKGPKNKIIRSYKKNGEISD